VVTRLCNNRGSGVFCAVRSVPRNYNESLFVALISTESQNQENSGAVEYNGIGIGSSEVVQQSTRTRIGSIGKSREKLIVEKELEVSL
jgi:hypothetical protein